MHLLVAPGRAHEWAWEGAALAAVGVVQIGLGLALLFGTRHLITVGLFVTLAPAVALLVTRTAGYPFGPFDGKSPSVSGFEFVLIAISVVTGSLLGGTLMAGTELLGAPGIRFDTVSLLVVVAAAVPGLAVSSWVDDASHFAGSQHIHPSTAMPMTTSLSPDDRDALGRQLVEVRSVALAWPTLSDALADGWTSLGPTARGVGQMVVRTNDEASDLRIDSPFALLYLSSESDAPIVGVQYTAWEAGDPPKVFVGQESMWHLHPTACETETEIVVPMDEPITGSRCELIDGSPADRSSFMLRVWVVPGWENPSGTFAHDNPLIP